MWLIPRHWYGWLWYLLNEALWLVYGFAIGSTPIKVMALIWGAVGIRNLRLARRLERA